MSEYFHFLINSECKLTSQTILVRKPNRLILTGSWLTGNSKSSMRNLIPFRSSIWRAEWAFNEYFIFVRYKVIAQASSIKILIDCSTETFSKNIFSTTPIEVWNSFLDHCRGCQNFVHFEGDSRARNNARDARKVRPWFKSSICHMKKKKTANNASVGCAKKSAPSVSRRPMR